MIKSTLRFSFVGLVPVVEQVKGRRIINVVLKSDTEVLDEVVVTALGIKKREKEVGLCGARFRCSCAHQDSGC